MGLIDAATAPLRYVIQAAEGEADKAAPLRDIAEIQGHVLGAVEAMAKATEQIEAHVKMIERLAASLVPLTESIVPLVASVERLSDELAAVPQLTTGVQALSDKLGVVAEVLAPLANAEAEVGKIGHLFSRHRSSGEDGNSA